MIVTALVCAICLQTSEAEHSHTALFVSFSGLGVSLINCRSEELAYVSLSGSTTTWEVESKNKGRWKKLPMELSAWLEERWQHDASAAILPDILEVEYVKVLFRSVLFRFEF